MQNITNLLLKHGIEGLLFENQDFFKQNITQALAIKLNESIVETKQLASKTLLQPSWDIKDTVEIKEFVNFVHNFTPGKYKFKNGSSINITESDLKSLLLLFESLKPENKQQMVEDLFTDGDSFKQHLEFSKKASALL